MVALADPGLEASVVQERVREALAAAEHGSPTLVTVLGREGSGKSRLVADIVRDYRGRGWTVLAATGTQERREVPRGVLLDALAPLLPNATSSPAGELPASSKDFGVGIPLALSALLPAPPRKNPQPADSRRRGTRQSWEPAKPLPPSEGDAVLLRRIFVAASRKPVLLALDDGHCFDELTIRFLKSLVARADKEHLAVLVCLDPRQDRGLARDFGPRSRGGLAAASFTLTDPETPPARPPAPVPTTSPSQPADPDEEFLAQAAALGMEFDPERLTAVLGVTSDAVQGFLERAMRHGWVWREGDEYHFSGDATRSWALSLSRAPPKELHARAARALEALYPQAEGRVLFDLARHWQEAGEGARAFPYLLRSAEAAYRSGAYATATERLQRAQRLLTTLPMRDRGAQEVRILVAQAATEDAARGSTASESLLRHAILRATEVGLDPVEVARVEVALGGLLRRRGQARDAVEVLESARRRAAAAEAPTCEAAVLSRLAMVQRRQGQHTEASATVERALAMLGEGGTPEERGLVHSAAADVWLWGSPAERGRAPAEIAAARKAWEEAGQPTELVDLANLEGLLAYNEGQMASAAYAWELAADQATRLGSVVEAANIRANLAEGYALLNQLPEARRCLNEARELMQHLDEPRVNAQVRLGAAYVAWREGSATKADHEIERALETLTSDGTQDLRSQFLFLRTRLLYESSQRSEARRVLEGIAGERYPSRLSSPDRAFWDEVMASPRSPEPAPRPSP